MARTPSEIIDELGFSFILGHYGWSDLHINCACEAFSCRISAVFSDDVSELLTLCRGILANASTSILLYDEPGGHRLSITRDEQQQHTMMLSLAAFRVYNPSVEDETSLVSARIKRKQLLGLVMAELWKAAHFLQEPSFRKSRTKDFPTDTLRELNSAWDADKSLGPSFLK